MAAQFEPVDVVRPAVWNDDQVHSWYRQNTLLYVQRERLGELGLPESPADLPLSVVHPELYLRKIRKASSLRGSWKQLRRNVASSLGTALSRLRLRSRR